MNRLKFFLLTLLVVPCLVIAQGTPPQIINKLCSANTFFSQIQPGPNNIKCTQPTYNGLAGLPTFIDSLVLSAGSARLVGDTLTPGNSKYYGTNSIGTRGFYDFSGIGIAWGSITGTLSSQTDLQNALDAKQNSLTTGNLTDVGTDGITITGGTAAVIGSGTSVSQHVSDSTHAGYLSSSDWTAFNAKQSAGSYITSLSGDGLASGPGASAFTLSTVNTNVGSFGSASVIPSLTINGKGLITAATTNSVQISESQVNGLVSDLAGKQATGNYITALTGDVVASGPGSSSSTIQSNVVSNAKLAQMSANTIKGNNTASTANASDLTIAQVQAMLSISGSNTGDVSLSAVGSTPSANGASLSGQALTLQPADGTHPGLVTSGSQTIGGSKTFSSTISASNLSGTNTGDITIGTANGLSLSGQALSLSSIPDGALATSYIKADGTRPLTASWTTGAFQILESAGTVSAPSYSNSTGKTGMYFSGEAARFSANQVQSGGYDTSGRWGFGGNSAQSGVALAVDGTSSTGSDANQTSFYTQSAITSAAAGNTGIGYYSDLTTSNSAFSLDQLVGFYFHNRTKGAASTISKEVAFGGFQPTQGTNNAFLTDSPNSFTGNYGVLIAGSSQNKLTGPTAIGGTTTNDSAAAGFVGEYISSSPGVSAAGTTNTWTNYTSIALTAGDWDLSGCLQVDGNGATMATTNYHAMAISINSGTTTSDQVKGDNEIGIAAQGASGAMRGVCDSDYRLSLSGPTTVYLKSLMVYTVAVPNIYGRISARRVR